MDTTDTKNLPWLFVTYEVVGMEVSKQDTNVVILELEDDNGGWFRARVLKEDAPALFDRFYFNKL